MCEAVPVKCSILGADDLLVPVLRAFTANSQYVRVYVWVRLVVCLSAVAPVCCVGHTPVMDGAALRCICFVSDAARLVAAFVFALCALASAVQKFVVHHHRRRADATCWAAKRSQCCNTTLCAMHALCAERRLPAGLP